MNIRKTMLMSGGILSTTAVLFAGIPTHKQLALWSRLITDVTPSQQVAPIPTPENVTLTCWNQPFTVDAKSATICDPAAWPPPPKTVDDFFNIITDH